MYRAAGKIYTPAWASKKIQLVKTGDSGWLELFNTVKSCHVTGSAGKLGYFLEQIAAEYIFPQRIFLRSPEQHNKVPKLECGR